MAGPAYNGDEFDALVEGVIERGENLVTPQDILGSTCTNNNPSMENTEMTERELDVLVAMKALRWRDVRAVNIAGADFIGKPPFDPYVDTPVFQYSSDPEQRHWIEEALAENGSFQTTPHLDEYYVSCYVKSEDRSYVAVGKTEEIALCRVALKAALKREDLPEDILQGMLSQVHP